MAIYAGTVNKSNNFYNFKPIYKYENSSLIKMTANEIAVLLPESEKEDINIYTKDFGKRISLYDGDLIAIEFDRSELEDNLIPYSNERNRTGYKMEYRWLQDNRRIISLGELGYYYVVSADKIIGNYRKNPTIGFDDSYAYEGLEAVIQIPEKKNTFIGPYTVERSERDNSLFVRTALQTQKYVITGKKLSAVLSEYAISEEVFEDCTARFVRLDKQTCTETEIDVITDEQLVNEFKNTLESDLFTDGKLDLTNLPELIAGYRKSLLIGGISEKIQNTRFERLRRILTDESNLNKAFSMISESISRLVDRYQETEEYGKLIETLLQDKTFTSRFPKFTKVMTRLETAEKEVKELENDKQRLNDEIGQLNEEKKKAVETQYGEYTGKIKVTLDDDIEAKKKELEKLKMKRKTRKRS